VPVEQATIGRARSLVIKGEISGTESLYIDESRAPLIAGHRVTIGSNGSAAAHISAREVVIIGEVQGNIECTDRLDIRSQGSLTGDVITPRISVEDGAILKGGVQIRSAEQKTDKSQQAKTKQASAEPAKPSPNRAAQSGSRGRRHLILLASPGTMSRPRENLATSRRSTWISGLCDPF